MVGLPASWDPGEDGAPEEGGEAEVGVTSSLISLCSTLRRK